MDVNTDERTIRFECLRIVVASNSAGHAADDVVAVAQKYFDFVQGTVTAAADGVAAKGF